MCDYVQNLFIFLNQYIPMCDTSCYSVQMHRFSAHVGKILIRKMSVKVMRVFLD